MTKKFALLLIGILFMKQACADCQTIYQKAQDADLQTLEALYQEAQTTPNCDDAFRTNLGRQIALKYLQQADNQLSLDPEAKVFDLLQKSLQYARLWQALAMTGDVFHERGNFYQAASYYQEALDVIANPAATQKAPAPVHIRTIFRKAERSRLLADKYVPTTVDRAGVPAGLAASHIRGFVVEKTEIPITFEFDSTKFDAKGGEAAADMLHYLTQQGSPDIILIGHTDPRGTDTYNLALSQRRAEAVKQFLFDHDYQGQIDVEGRGEREPPQDLDDPQAYSEDELYRLHRRVELRRQ